MNVSKYTDFEIDIIVKHYPTTSTIKLSAMLPGRNQSSITSMAKKLGIKKAVGFGKKKYWTADELDYLKQHYSTAHNRDLQVMFNCSFGSLYTAANRLYLKKTKQYLSETFSDNLRIVGKNSRFKKGNIAINKGKKMADYCSAEAIERIKEGQFKKGIIPHNIVEVGSERITRDGYTEIKIADCLDSKRNFKLKHRFIWEQNFGPIEKNEVVEFIDGNKQNFDLNNFRKVTRKQNLLNNQSKDTCISKKYFKIKSDAEILHFIENYKPLIEMKRNQLKLTKKIKEHAANL